MATRPEISQLPFANRLGMELKEAGPDKVVAAIAVKKEHCTVPDIMHGGAIMQKRPMHGRRAALHDRRRLLDILHLSAISKQA